MAKERVLTKDQLAELESAPKSRGQKVLDYIICLLPTLFGAAAILEYCLLPNYKGNKSTNVYIYFLGILTAAVLLLFVLSLFHKKIFVKFRYKAPFYSFIFVLLIAYDCLTLKSGTLILPYFPWTDQVLNAIIDDRLYLLDCIKNSLILLFTGYFTGAVLG